MMKGTGDRELAGRIRERDYKNRQWRIRRQRQIHSYIGIMVLLAVFVIGMCFSFHVLSTKAQTEEEPIFYKYYTSIEITYGDTLWSIAQEYCDEHYSSLQDYMKEVVRINHIWEQDDLTAGHYLIVPYYSTEYKK